MVTRLGHLGPDTEAGAAEVFSEMVAKCDNFVSVASQDQVCVYQQQQKQKQTLQQLLAEQSFHICIRR